MKIGDVVVPVTQITFGYGYPGRYSTWDNPDLLEGNPLPPYVESQREVFWYPGTPKRVEALDTGYALVEIPDEVFPTDWWVPVNLLVVLDVTSAESRETLVTALGLSA